MIDRLRLALALAVCGAGVFAIGKLTVGAARAGDRLAEHGFVQADAIARARIEQAAQWRNLWSGTRALREQAVRANSRGKILLAITLARRAAREARLAVNQVRLESARYRFEQTPEAAGWSAAQRARMTTALRAHDGATALALSAAYAKELGR